MADQTPITKITTEQVSEVVTDLFAGDVDLFRASFQALIPYLEMRQVEARIAVLRDQQAATHQAFEQQIQALESRRTELDEMVKDRVKSSI